MDVEKKVFPKNDQQDQNVLERKVEKVIFFRRESSKTWMAASSKSVALLMCKQCNAQLHITKLNTKYCLDQILNILNRDFLNAKF